jgi:hypothetical protein
MIKNYTFKLFNTSSNTNIGFNLLNNSTYNNMHFLFMYEITLIFKECLDDNIITGYLNNVKLYVIQFENILRKIQILINKHKVFKNYKRYSSYLALQNLLIKMDTLIYEKDLQKKYDNLVISCEQHSINICTKKTDNSQVSLQIETVIKIEYFHYILKYGLPKDGLFLPSLLAEFLVPCSC